MFETPEARMGGSLARARTAPERTIADVACTYTHLVLYRLYKPEDFAQLYAIEEACFEPALRFSRNMMRRLVAGTHAATWIAEEDAKMVGFAMVEWEREAGAIVAYVATIEVVEEKRRLGIGAELLRHAEQSAQAAGAEVIWLHVDAENASAIRLYEARGYALQGREANFYPRGRAALVYARRMAAAAQ